MSDRGGDTTVRIRRCLERLNAQDAAARTELLEHSRQRLTLLAQRMFAGFPQLHRREQAEDLFQEAMVRLWKALEEVGPATVGQFMGLAALQMRRALCDLARSHFGRGPETGAEGQRPVIKSAGNRSLDDRPTDPASAPDELACWSEFHAAADRLPEPERTAFDLLYYHELPSGEVAELMAVTERQVRRYWQSARRSLHRMLEGCLPKL